MAVSKPSISSSHKLWANIKRWGRNAPAYIVIHFTAGFSKNSDNYMGMLSTYKSYVARGSNAHYLVGRGEIWEMVNPKTHYCTYSCGSDVGKKNQCELPGWFGGKLAMSHAGVAGHRNTINVEICSCKAGLRRCNPKDTDWYFSDGAYMNAVMLTAWLCDEFGIKVDHIIMHNQVTGKLCPAMWCNQEGAEAGFDQFRMDVSKLLNDVQEDTPVSPNPEPAGGAINVAADSLFYSRPNSGSVIVGIAQENTMMSYSIQNGNFYYTDNGWVEG